MKIIKQESVLSGVTNISFQIFRLKMKRTEGKPNNVMKRRSFCLILNCETSAVETTRFRCFRRALSIRRRVTQFPHYCQSTFGVEFRLLSITLILPIVWQQLIERRAPWWENVYEKFVFFPSRFIILNRTYSAIIIRRTYLPLSVFFNVAYTLYNNTNKKYRTS